MHSERSSCRLVHVVRLSRFMEVFRFLEGLGRVQIRFLVGVGSLVGRRYFGELQGSLGCGGSLARGSIRVMGLGNGGLSHLVGIFTRDKF